MLTVGNDSDDVILSDLNERYHSLIEEKFLLIDRLKNQHLFYFQRVSLRMQLANLHHHVLTTDSIRHYLIFGGKYEVPSDSATSLRQEIENELVPGFNRQAKQLKETIEQLNNRLSETMDDKIRYQAGMYRANKKLRDNGLSPVFETKERVDILKSEEGK